MEISNSNKTLNNGTITRTIQCDRYSCMLYGYVRVPSLYGLLYCKGEVLKLYGDTFYSSG